MTAYPVHIIAGEPCFDRLPVMKLLCLAETPVNARIYAQAQIGLCDKSFMLRIWAFETSPSSKSTLQAVLLGPQGKLDVSADAMGKTSLTIGAEDRTACLTVSRISGEDLQGKYWGVVMTVPIEIFKTFLAVDAIEKGTVIKGNIFKIHPAVSAVFLPFDNFSQEQPYFGEFYVC